jgi:polyphosphate glucokinase
VWLKAVTQRSRQHNGNHRAGGQQVRPRRVLVIDVGGSRVKCLVTGATKPREFKSWRDMTAAQMAERVLALVDGWSFDVVAIGYPGAVAGNRPAQEPHNLGPGWKGFDFARVLERPVKVVNDSAMQAYGAYRGGKMLFLGLGTGLGTALIVDGLMVPMELAHLPYKKHDTYEDRVGKRGLERFGEKKWLREVERVIELFRRALLPEYIVLGGGNAGKIKSPPPHVGLVDNHAAFVGGFRLWEPAWVSPDQPRFPRRHVRADAKIPGETHHE